MIFWTMFVSTLLQQWFLFAKIYSVLDFGLDFVRRWFQSSIISTFVSDLDVARRQLLETDMAIDFLK